MNPFQYIKYLSHHAYFIHSFEHAVEKLKDFLKKTLHIEHAKNPDFFHEKYEVMGIEESRKIKEIHLSKSFTENAKRIFIIESQGMTHEAQNSLLKIFEEPNEDSHFFLVMPSAELLLPTLRSRLHILGRADRQEGETEKIREAKKFLKLSIKERMVVVEELAKRIKDEKSEKSEAIIFLGALEQILAENGVEKNKKALKAVLKSADYMNDRSPSVKQLLEFVAMSI